MATRGAGWIRHARNASWTLPARYARGVPEQRIRRLEFAELPKTISGKIRRVDLHAREAGQGERTEPARAEKRVLGRGFPRPASRALTLTRVSEVEAVQPLGDAARLLSAFALDDEVDDDLQAAIGDGLDRDECRAGTDPRAGRYRRRKPHLVQPVVDPEAHALEVEDLTPHRHQQREGQESVSNRGAERACSGTLRIDVDPLVIIGRIRERVDLVLSDLAPLAVPQVFAREGCQLGNAGDSRGHSCSSVRDALGYVRSVRSCDLETVPDGVRDSESVARQDDHGNLALGSLL